MILLKNVSQDVEISNLNHALINDFENEINREMFLNRIISR